MNARDAQTRLADELFVERSRQLLEAGNERLSAHVCSRLARGRDEALSHAMPARGLWARQWAPALGLAGAAAVAVMIWPGGHPGPGSSSGAVRTALDLEDLDIVLAEDSLELFEDLDFYEWLGDEGEAS